MLYSQQPSWEETLPLPDFPSPSVSGVRPSTVTPVVIKEKEKRSQAPKVFSGVPKISVASLLRLSLALLLIITPLFFLGSFFLVRLLMEKGKKADVTVVTVLPSPSASLSDDIFIPLPRRLSSAVIPLPPSQLPADQTRNWEVYINPTLRFSLKYPKEWFLTEFHDTSPYVLKLSYPVESGKIDTFVPGEKAYVLVSWQEKQGETVESMLQRVYGFSGIKIEEIKTTGKKGWRIYNTQSKGEITAFFELGQKIISLQGVVKDQKDIPVYKEVFILMQDTFTIL